ncbi:MAG: GNAT family N-acetyltransferase [Pseudomonadota bacterium]|nr:GNAT family N-acetyltransferase [Pseudomonadota bacterium]
MDLIDGVLAAEGSTDETVAATTAVKPASNDAGPAAPTQRDWVPIRSLAPRHRERILAHLTALDERSRYLRFGYAANDAHIARYVDTLDFEHDEVFGIFNRRLELIAMAHLAYRPASAAHGRDAAAEFGVSVLPKARRRGFGRRLFEHAMLHARNRGVRAMFIHALSENVAMLKIARNAGAAVERDGSESEAWLSLPKETFASHLDEMVGERLAEFDYRLKHHTHRAGNLSKRSGETGNGDG